MTRTRLPDRRQNVTHNLGDFTITIGFDAAGAAVEVFADGWKGDMASVAADACILISIALQSGITIADLRKSMGTVPDLPRGEFAEKPASVIGRILEAMTR